MFCTDLTEMSQHKSTNRLPLQIYPSAYVMITEAYFKFQDLQGHLRLQNSFTPGMPPTERNQPSVGIPAFPAIQMLDGRSSSDLDPCRSRVDHPDLIYLHK
jgi:hypothetical protein